MGFALNKHGKYDAQAGDGWDEGWREEPVRQLTRDEARALMAREPSVSPWVVVAVQLGVGLVVALIAWVVAGGAKGFWSALYGAAVVVVPGALMARGITSRFSNATPSFAAVSFMLWQGLKIAVSVVMLMAAHRIVPALSWPALLAGLVLCIKVYWVALLWRRRPKDEADPSATKSAHKHVHERETAEHGRS